jgi:hypothetical protein
MKTFIVTFWNRSWWWHTIKHWFVFNLCHGTIVCVLSSHHKPLFCIPGESVTIQIFKNWTYIDSSMAIVCGITYMLNAQLDMLRDHFVQERMPYQRLDYLTHFLFVIDIHTCNVVMCQRMTIFIKHKQLIIIYRILC